MGSQRKKPSLARVRDSAFRGFGCNSLPNYGRSQRFRATDRLESNYLAGGRMTESMMWITPLEASTSVAKILAPLT